MNKLIILPVFCLLTACNITVAPPRRVSTSIEESSESTQSIESSSSQESSQATSEIITSEGPGVVDYEGKYAPEDYHMAGNYSGKLYMPAKGNVNTLVIPVVFDEYRELATEALLQDIGYAFNGNNVKNKYYSVNSYYQYASNNLLNLSSYVTGYFDSTISMSALNDDITKLHDLVVDAVNWAKTYFDSPLTFLDSDKNGFIDGVYLIYIAPDYSVNTSLSETFWAFTSWVGGKSNLNSPVPNSYVWASYDFMYEGYGENAIDSHTYIHETGHMLGLDDYYSYSEKSYEEYYSPYGGVGMMDLNVGDLDGFSKYSLGWVKGKLVDKAGITTMRTNEVYIIPNKSGFNGAFDEYILLELYSNNGLNYKDLVGGYNPRKDEISAIRGDDVFGIRAYHIDARIAEFEYNRQGEIVNTSYIPTFSSCASTKYASVAHTNTPDGYTYSSETKYESYPSLNIMGKDFRLITQLSSSGRVFGTNGYYLAKEDLYTKGQGISSFTDSSVASQFPRGSNTNKGGKFAYSFQVRDINKGLPSAEIEFKAL